MTKYKRAHPRITREIPVEIELPELGAVHATAVNISCAGLQLVCDHGTIETLLPEGARTPPGALLSLQVRLAHASQDDHSAVIGVSCRTVFTRRVSEREYRIGLSIQSFDDDGYERLERYIDHWISGGD